MHNRMNCEDFLINFFFFWKFEEEIHFSLTLFQLYYQLNPH